MDNPIFRERPVIGVRADDADGAYYFISPDGPIQLIVIGPMLCEPKVYAHDLGNGLGMNLRVSRVGALAPSFDDAGKNQMVLDRGFFDIWMVRA